MTASRLVSHRVDGKPFMIAEIALDEMRQKALDNQRATLTVVERSDVRLPLELAFPYQRTPVAKLRWLGVSIPTEVPTHLSNDKMLKRVTETSKVGGSV